MGAVDKGCPPTREFTPNSHQSLLVPLATSMDPHPTSEKRTPDDEDAAKRKAELAKEFKHTKAGIWDVYEQVPHSKFGFDIPWIEKVARNLEILDDLPFFWRMVKEIMGFKSCRYYLCLFILVKTLVSLEPAVTLWYVILCIIRI